jgi:hypothetical protein
MPPNIEPPITTPVPPTENKKYHILFSLLMLLICTAVVGIVYFNTIGRKVEVPQELQGQNTPDQFANWQTYRSELYGFEIRYPSNWYVTEREDGIGVHEMNKVERSSIWISVTTDSLDNVEAEILSTVDDFLKAHINYGELIFADTKALHIDHGTAIGGGERHIIFARNDQTFHIQFDHTIPEDQAIVSTFKFISTSTQTQDISNWKTYRNDEYGFEFKYPENWVDEGRNIKLQNYFTDQERAVLNIEVDKSDGSTYDYATTAVRQNNCPGDRVIGNYSDGTLYVLHCSATSEDYNFVIVHENLDIIKLNYHDDFPDNVSEEEKLTRFKGIISTFKFISISANNSNDSGIMGKVTIGPTCPVETYPPTPDCADKPYATKLRFVKNDTDYVVFAQSNTDGDFSISLEPGTYWITVPDLSKQMPSLEETKVVVQDKVYTNINLKFDSGIR